MRTFAQIGQIGAGAAVEEVAASAEVKAEAAEVAEVEAGSSIRSNDSRSRGSSGTWAL